MTGTRVDQASSGHWLTAGPGAATDQQARLAFFNLQQFAFRRLGQDRLDHVLAFGQWRNLVEIGVRRLQGEGMTLSVDGQVTRSLLPIDPFAFSGESKVSCTLLGGPIRDFNLIYAPQRYSARLQWLDREQRFFSEAGTVLVFSVSDTLGVSVGNSAQQLGRHDCLQLVGNIGLLEVSIRGACCVIELTSRA